MSGGDKLAVFVAADVLRQEKIKDAHESVERSLSAENIPGAASCAIDKCKDIPQTKEEKGPENLREFAEILSSLGKRGAASSADEAPRKRKRANRRGEKKPAASQPTPSTPSSGAISPKDVETVAQPSSTETVVSQDKSRIDTFGDKPGSQGGAGSENGRKRRRTTPEEQAALDNIFEKEEVHHPSREQRMDLARVLNMTPRQIQVWFQNKRQKVKRQKEHLMY